MARIRKQRITVYDAQKKRYKKTSIGNSPNSFGNGRNKRKPKQSKYRGQGK